MTSRRSRPYIWATWLAPLLSGDDSCEWKVWFKAHYQGYEKIPRDFNSAEWTENHTALLTTLQNRYGGSSCERMLIEGQTRWTIEGRSADVAGKMDIVTIGPNRIIDAKTGKRKDAHVVQMKIYLLAVEMEALPGVSGKFTGLLHYPGDVQFEVPEIDEIFRERFYRLVKRVAGETPLVTIPSKNECQFCDIAQCPDRVSEDAPAVKTDLF